jgi:hypothetical protein
LLSRSPNALLKLTVMPSLESDDSAELSSSLSILPSPFASSFSSNSSANFLLLAMLVLLALALV